MATRILQAVADSLVSDVPISKLPKSAVDIILMELEKKDLSRTWEMILNMITTPHLKV